MAKDLGADWGIPYYNRKKPKSYMEEQKKARISCIDNQIRLLQEEKNKIFKKI